MGAPSKLCLGGIRKTAEVRLFVTSPALVQSNRRGRIGVKRNTVVIGVVLLILATFAWAGWANWEYRKQAAEKRLANAAQGELVASAGDPQAALSPLIGKPAPEFSLLDLTGKKVSLADYKGKA